MQKPIRLARIPLGLLLLGTAILGLPRAAHASSEFDRLYAPCVVCHQASAWGSVDGTIPSLAGQQRRYLEKQLAAFRSGDRVDTAMQTVAAHPSMHNARDISVLAKALSDLAPNPKPVQGTGEPLGLAEEMYGHICAACHGLAGQGDAGNRVPRIAGQHYPYLRRQIEAAADLHKDLAPPEMTSALRGMRPQDRDLIADYISRLGASGGDSH